MAERKLHVEEVLLTDSVSKHYQKFFDKFSEIETLPIEEWKTAHIVGYLCKKYKAHYGFRYSFKFNNPAPSKSYEVYQINKLANMLSSDPKILKNYLDWVFENKVIERKKRITSLGYFSHADIVNEYKFKFLLNKKNAMVGRTDALSDSIRAICSRYGFDISTYAELAFLKKMPDQDALFQALNDVGFKVDILDKIA
jgi:hypothetical protein